MQKIDNITEEVLVRYGIVVDDIREFMGHIGYIEGQRISNGECSWVPFILVCKEFMLSKGKVNGKIPFDADVLSHVFLKKCYNDGMVEYRVNAGNLEVRLKVN